MVRQKLKNNQQAVLPLKRTHFSKLRRVSSKMKAGLTRHLNCAGVHLEKNWIRNAIHLMAPNVAHPLMRAARTNLVKTQKQGSSTHQRLKKFQRKDHSTAMGVSYLKDLFSQTMQWASHLLKPLDANSHAILSMLPNRHHAGLPICDTQPTAKTSIIIPLVSKPNKSSASYQSLALMVAKTCSRISLHNKPAWMLRILLSVSRPL